MPKALAHYGQSLPPQERDQHNLWIGLRVRALLGNYWITSPSEVELQITVGDWMDALSEFSPEEITGACQRWVIDNPTRRPNFGSIRKLIMDRRGRILERRRQRQPEAQRIEEQPRERISAERARQIMAEVAAGDCAGASLEAVLAAMDAFRATDTADGDSGQPERPSCAAVMGDNF